GGDGPLPAQARASSGDGGTVPGQGPDPGGQSRSNPGAPRALAQDVSGGDQKSRSVSLMKALSLSESMPGFPREVTQRHRSAAQPFPQIVPKPLCKQKGPAALCAASPLLSRCWRQDSNLHSLDGNQALNLARLPIRRVALAGHPRGKPLFSLGLRTNKPPFALYSQGDHM